MHHTGSSSGNERLPVIAFGADYNPEQWPRHVWEEDVALMRQANINLVTIAVFSWATIEPLEGQRDFTWLDDIIDLLWENGIAVDLATPIASPPPWMGAEYPETLAVWPNGQRSTWGSRNHFSPASAKYREFCTSITTEMVERYAQHPAIAMWHIGNEFGQLCYGDESAQRFRGWLRDKYGTLDQLNNAWGTSFWSQKYGAWDHIIPPRDTTYLHNPAQELDFKRFSSDLMLEMYLEQVAIIRKAKPDATITTNFMGFFHLIDYHTWAEHIDIISDDIYPDPQDPYAASTTALTHELMRSLGAGKPWMLMEQAITTVNWRPHNVPKTPQRTQLESLSAVARGSRGVCFFQWRQSTSGSERYHSALLTHAGPEADVHKATRKLGADLKELSALYQDARGNTTSVGNNGHAPVALVFDWSSWWVTGQPALPSNRLDAYEQLKVWHRQLWLRGVRVDIVSPDADLAPYKAVLAPSLHLLDQKQADAMLEFSHAGGHLMFGPFSAVSDTTNRVNHERFPAVLQQHSTDEAIAGIGVHGQEWIPLPDRASELALTGKCDTQAELLAHTFVEKLDVTGPDTTVHYRFAQLQNDPYALSGRPAVTQLGTNWYVGAVLDPDTLGQVLDRLLKQAGIAVLPAEMRKDSLDLVRDRNALFVLNYGTESEDLDVQSLSEFFDVNLTQYLPDPTQEKLSVGPQDSTIIALTDRETA